MSTGTFILGVGAQKAGTTWLHHYLSKAQGVYPGLMKEYHFWDAMTLPVAAHLRPRLLDVFRGRALAEVMLHRSPARYFDHFARAVARPEIHTAMDITPAYAGLSAETFTQIRQGFADHDIAVRVVFLMRDPVARCLSTVRMHRANGNMLEGVRTDLAMDEAFARYVAGSEAQARTRYDRTVAALEAAFPPKELYIGIYESMFDAAKLTDLSTFLGVAPSPDLANQRVHATKGDEAVSADARAAARAAFVAVYDWAADRFPDKRRLWPQPEG